MLVMNRSFKIEIDNKTKDIYKPFRIDPGLRKLVE